MNVDNVNAVEAVYLFIGEDAFLRRQELDRIKAGLFHGLSEDADYTIFYGSQNRVREIIETARTLPFGEQRRLIVVKEADLLPASDKEALIRYCLNPSRKSCVVIESEEPNPRGPFREVLTGKTKVVFCQPPTGDRPERLVRKLVRESGKGISAEAVELIKGKTGGDSGVIAGAVEKVILYVGERQEITAGDVEKLTGRNIENSVFDLLRAVENKKAPAALAVLRALFHERVEPPEILGVLGWQFRRLKKIKLLLARGYTEPQIARELRIKNRFVLAKILRQAETSRPAALKKKLGDLLEADVAFKSGKVKPRSGMEFLVMKLCRD